MARGENNGGMQSKQKDNSQNDKEKKPHEQKVPTVTFAHHSQDVWRVPGLPEFEIFNAEAYKRECETALFLGETYGD